MSGIPTTSKMTDFFEPLKISKPQAELQLGGKILEPLPGQPLTGVRVVQQL